MRTAGIEVEAAQMEQHAVAEGLEVAMATALDPHGLDAGVEAFGCGVGDPQAKDAHDAFQVPFDSIGQRPHGRQPGGLRHRDPQLEMVSRFLLARALAIQAKGLLQPVRFGGVFEPFADVGNLLLGSFLLAGSGRQKAVASLLEEGRALGVIHSLENGDLLAANLLHCLVGQLHDMEWIEDNSCLVEDILGSLLKGTVQIHRYRSHMRQDRRAKPFQCGFGAGGGVALDHLLDDSALGVAHHRGALAAVPVLLVDREVRHGGRHVLQPRQRLALQTSLNGPSSDAIEAILACSQDLRSTAARAAKHQIDREGFKQKREARLRLCPRYGHLLNSVLRTGDARDGADQHGLELAGVQVPPDTRRSVVVDAARRAAVRAGQQRLGPVNHLDAHLAEGRIQIYVRDAPGRRQAKDVGVKRRAVQGKLSSEGDCLKGASATKIPVDPAFTGYFRNRASTKNIEHPYKDYSGHFALGVIYSQSEKFIDEKNRFTLEELESIPSVIHDFMFFVQPKYKIAKDQPGSGNTKNIGGITNISRLVNGRGPFSELGESVFDDFWMYYLTKDMAKALEIPRPYTNLKSYVEYKKNGIDLLEAKEDLIRSFEEDDSANEEEE